MTVLQNETTKVLRVKAPQAVAFTVFTQMTSWWPMKTHHIGKVDPAGVQFEPRVGGRWVEKGVDGAECTLGRALAWESPCGSPSPGTSAPPTNLTQPCRPRSRCSSSPSRPR